jgi:electron-transferring-flavoprotein dehydrogenase
MPKLAMPGGVLVGDAGGMVDTVSLKGVHHAITLRPLAGEAIYASCAAVSRPSSPTSRRSRRSPTGAELYRVRNTRQPFQRGFVAWRAAGQPRRSLTRGRLPRGRLPWQREMTSERCSSARPSGAIPSRMANTPLTSSRRSTSVGNTTRDDAPNHIRVRERVPREIAETWRWMCPAGVYEIAADAPSTGDVDVIVNYTNCVQCGAITAKGGRLTPPEGGDGPLYQLT